MNPEMLPALKQIEKERHIPLEKILQAIEDALLRAYEKNYGANQNVVIEIDRNSGELHIWQRKLVVPEVMNPDVEMSLEDAKLQYESAEVGMELDLEVPNDAFGRIAASTAKQVIFQRIREFERDVIREEYLKRKGEVLFCTVQSYKSKEVIVDLGRTEGVIPQSEQAHNEHLKNGDRVRVIITDVRENQHGVQIVVSRSSPELLKCLFEQEVPELQKGVIQIRAVAREAGLRSKIAVKSLDPNIDPVGACVGPKGNRVQGIVDELRGEKIDVIPWSKDDKVFIANSLQPSKVLRVDLNISEKTTSKGTEEVRNALVIVPDQQLPLAIGREGQNARLAAKLTGWHIDIKNETTAKAESLLTEEPIAQQPAQAPSQA